jgi:hypothetical protein
MILLIALLLAIAAFRMFGTSPATAAPKLEISPTGPRAGQPFTPPAIEAGEGVPSDDATGTRGPDVPPAPPPRRRTAPAETDEDRPKAFIPPSVTTPRAAMKQDLTETLPEVQAIEVKAVPLASPNQPAALPKPEDKGSRVGKVAKSVGKIFGFGRKDPADPAK